MGVSFFSDNLPLFLVVEEYTVVLPLVIGIWVSESMAIKVSWSTGSSSPTLGSYAIWYHRYT